MLDVLGLDRLNKVMKNRGISLDVIDDMIELFNYQDPEGRELLFELLSRFEVCEFDQYKIKGRALADALIGVLPDELKAVVLLPVLDKVPAAKSKSGDAVAWMMSRSLKRAAFSSGRSFEMASQTVSSSALARASTTAFLMVDDYIGSGKTANSAVSRLIEQGVPPENITVAAFVGMTAAKLRLAPIGVRTLFLSTLSKGISDAPGIADKKKAISVMRRMEDSMEVGRQFKLGFEKSEALALMCFCPNNTFPVFWWKGPTWSGVFER